MQGGRVTDTETYVGGRWRAGRGRVTDLGLVPAQEAADLLLALAPQVYDDDGGELVTAATLADSVVVWPQLLRMARDDRSPGGDPAAGGVLAGSGRRRRGHQGPRFHRHRQGGDIEIRKQAVFALSQRPADEGVPVLIRIARTNRHPELRKTALFWLGQSEDPRALTLFEEILRLGTRKSKGTWENVPFTAFRVTGPSPITFHAMPAGRLADALFSAFLLAACGDPAAARRRWWS